MKLANILREYQQHLGRHHPEVDALVTVLKRYGWITYPTGYRAYTVSLQVSGPGYRTIKATLTIESSGKWDIR